VLYSWSASFENPNTGVGTTQYNLTTISTDGNQSTVPTSNPLQPTLQRQDGTFVGNGAQGMVAFDQFGNQKWAQPNYIPQIATSDNGVVAQSPTGQYLTLDQLGNVTGQMPCASPTVSWTNNVYQMAPVIQVSCGTPPSPASPAYANAQNSNLSHNNASLVCGNNSDNLVAEYAANKITDITTGQRFSPICKQASQSAHSSFFYFNEINNPCPSLNEQPEFPFALIRNPLVIPDSSGYGLDAWRQNYGSSRIINSGFRDPSQNTACGSTATSGSRHMFGDAVDLRNQSRTVMEWNNMFTAANDAGADYIEYPTEACEGGTFHIDVNGETYAGCIGWTHADWRDHSGEYAP
jgi:hypothetical protein